MNAGQFTVVEVKANTIDALLQTSASFVKKYAPLLLGITGNNSYTTTLWFHTNLSGCREALQEWSGIRFC